MFFGIAGEVRAVVTDARGDVKIDTGFQKNLILNQGLDFFGGGKGGAINASCAIGGGNSTPVITQNALDAFIALVSGSETTKDYSYTDKGDNTYRMWEQRKYRFTGLDNANISEVGLVSTGSTSMDYYLTTRALIKDAAGAPTSISIKTGETLDIYYKVHRVVSTLDKAFQVNMVNGAAGAVAYNAVLRPTYVGQQSWDDITGAVVTPPDLFYSTQELSVITAFPDTTRLGDVTATKKAYVPGSHKVVINYFFGLSVGNTNIRTIFSLDSLRFLPFQMRFGSVANDSAIPKTANDTLTVPLEFSWGRYEGAL